MKTDWAEILQTDEYEKDFTLVSRLLTKSIGNDLILDQSNLFVAAFARLIAVNRYFIRHLPEMQDIDQTLFLDQIAEEVGLAIPATDLIPKRTLLTENKRWYGHKGNRTLFNFIGDLIGSPIDIHLTRDLIFRLDDPRSCLDGGDSIGLQLPWDNSKLACLHDGVFYAEFVYLVDVLQAQNIFYEADLFSLLDAVHPAGTQRFVRQFFNYFVPSAAGQHDTLKSFESFHDYDLIDRSVSTLDSDIPFILDDPNSVLDGLGGNFDLLNIDVLEIQRILKDSGFRRLSNDTLLHDFPHGTHPPTKPWAAFSRFISKPDGTYEEVFADNDAIVMENVTTNVGIAHYTWGELKNFTWRHLKHAAWDLDQKNMRGQWMPNLPSVSITES